MVKSKISNSKKPISIEEIPKFISWGNYYVDIEWSYLVNKVEKDQEEWGLDLEPDFQRGHVWSEEQRIKYIEFCLRGGRGSRDILFNDPTINRAAETERDIGYVLVDGLQRLTSIMRFMKGELGVFGGYTIKDFKERARLVTRNQWVKFYINDLQTRAEVLQWYLDLNQGGVIHTDQELARVRGLLEQCQTK